MGLAALAPERIRGSAYLDPKPGRSVLDRLPPRPLATVPPIDGVAVVTVWVPRSGFEAAPIPGVDHGRMVAGRFLIDPDGVLRIVWRKDDCDEGPTRTPAGGGSHDPRETSDD